jgi:tRNA-dihydrouridine synthase B
VQIAGADPAMMAEAAVFNANKGARIIDINMGCPVKKVCNVASGSALLRHEDLIARILDAVVEACAPLGVPVTLKTRTGWDRDSRNALRVARLAQDAGIAALTLHGRTRADLYTGEAEYDTIRAVRAELKIPLIANGDIDSPEKAKRVLDYTGADAVMIGRADADSFRDRMNLIDNTRDQWRAVSDWFLNLSRDGNPNPAPVAKALLAA